MIAPMRLSELAFVMNAGAMSATVHQGDCEFSCISTDTRAIEPGDLFVALRGENFDAHDFLTLAQEKQACGLVVERCDETVALPQLQVEDSTRALGQIAGLSRRRFKGPLIAITGSSGKTTVKGMVASILSECGQVHATRGNLNNHIGVPLTLLELMPEHQFAVIEMGASAAGEIAYLVSMARPDIVVVNNVMPAHVEGFGSIDGVAAAKSEIYQQLPGGGTAVINLDEPYSQQWLQGLDADRVLSYSVDAEKPADFTASNITMNQGGLMSFTLSASGNSEDISLRVAGRHNVANALAAAACARAAGADLAAIKVGLEKFTAVAGRMNVLPGLHGATVIDDSYNANPGSVRAAIDMLSEQPGTRALVLGDMGELGENAADLHGEIGRYAQEKGIDCLLTVGVVSKNASNEFGRKSQHFMDHESAISLLRADMNASSVVLVKGSRSARMETVVQAITERGEK